MLDITQQKGTATELHCILDLTNLRIRCLKPVDESSKYDVVADLGQGKFIRIQCKTSSWATDTKEEKVAFAISTCCATTNTKSTTRHKYSKDDIDYVVRTLADSVNTLRQMSPIATKSKKASAMRLLF